MKKVLLLFVCLISAISFGQTTKPTTFGIKGGVNLYSHMGELANGSSRDLFGTDFYAGLFADTQLNEKWSIENELLYSYGHFIEVPVHLKYHLNGGKWNFFLGPKLDFSVEKYDTSPLQLNANKSMGISIDLGTSYNITNRFFIEARYAIGLTQQINAPYANLYNATRNTLRFGVGFKF